MSTLQENHNTRLKLVKGLKIFVSMPLTVWSQKRWDFDKYNPLEPLKSVDVVKKTTNGRNTN